MATTTANHIKIDRHLELSNQALALARSPFGAKNTGPSYDRNVDSVVCFANTYPLDRHPSVTDPLEPYPVDYFPYLEI